MKRLVIAVICVLSLVAGSAVAGPKGDRPAKGEKQGKVRPTPEDRAAMQAELRLLQETFRDEQRLAHQECQQSKATLHETFRADRQAILDRYRSAPAPAPAPVPVPQPAPVPVEPPVP
jgi:hypothetical protein